MSTETLATSSVLAHCVCEFWRPCSALSSSSEHVEPGHIVAHWQHFIQTSFFVVCFLQWGAKTVSCFSSPTAHWGVATSGPGNVGVANGCVRPVLPSPTPPRPVTSNLESSRWASLDCRGEPVKHYEAVWFHVTTHFASTAHGQGPCTDRVTRRGCLLFLCKCSNSRMTEILKEARLVVGCGLCNVHFCWMFPTYCDVLRSLCSWETWIWKKKQHLNHLWFVNVTLENYVDGLVSVTFFFFILLSMKNFRNVQKSPRNATTHRMQTLSFQEWKKGLNI